jgi:hypothetical protein
MIALCAGNAAAQNNGEIIGEPIASSDDALLETLWADLNKEEPAASRALLKLAAQPEHTVAFLKPKMRPLKLTAKELRALLEKLGSDQEKVWKGAFNELKYLDPRLAIDLEDLMLDITTSPTRQRLVAVLSDRAVESLTSESINLRRLSAGRGFNFNQAGRSWWAEHLVSRLASTPSAHKREWLRLMRAIVLLEHIGTPDALAIFNTMASGHLDATPTKLASEAVHRLTSKDH